MKNKKVMQMMESKGMTEASTFMLQRRVGSKCAHLKRIGNYNPSTDLISTVQEMIARHYKGIFMAKKFSDIEPFNDSILQVSFVLERVENKELL